MTIKRFNDTTILVTAILAVLLMWGAFAWVQGYIAECEMFIAYEKVKSVFGGHVPSGCQRFR